MSKEYRDRAVNYIMLVQFDNFTLPTQHVLKEVTGAVYQENPTDLTYEQIDVIRGWVPDIIYCILEDVGAEGDHPWLDPNFLSQTEYEIVKDYLFKARKHMWELHALSDRDLKVRYDEARINFHIKRATASGHATAEAEDLFLFFSDPEASADFSKWLRRAQWTVDESVSLSLGKDPQIVNSSSLAALDDENGPSLSPFKQEYEERRLLVDLAIDIELKLPLKPSEFVRWCITKAIDIPFELRNLVQNANETFKALSEENLRLKKQVAALEREASALDRKSLRSLYQMLLVMALKRFNHKLDGNSNATTLISNAFKEFGLSADLKTIKKWLDEAAADASMEQALSKIRSSKKENRNT